MRALPNNAKSIALLGEILGSLMKSCNSLRREQDDSGTATILESLYLF